MNTTKRVYLAPPPLDWPIDVPEVSSVSETFDVVAYADFLLTNLLKHDLGILRGQFKDGVGRWCVRSLPDGQEVEIGRQEEVGIFRVVLARFGYWYMASQLYGGSAKRALFHQGRSYDCDIEMSNDNRFGYSLTVYAKVHTA
jgi:hypothetical protein